MLLLSNCEQLVQRLKMNPTVNFRGERRSNQTHASQTDPESFLARKGGGKESKLS